MIRTRNAIRSLACALAGAALLASCASTGLAKAAAPEAASSPAPAAQAAAPNAKADSGFPLAKEGSAFDSKKISAFAKESLGSFSTFTLSNGLPVIVKRNAANRVQHISLVIRGGSAAASPDKAGLEALALKTMARGSGSYSYEEVQALLDETSSSLGSAASFDSSSYSLTTLDKYFSRLFPIWVDTLVAPSFKQEDFDQELANAKLALEGKEQNPWQKTSLEMQNIFLAGHPYATSPDGTEESLAALKLDDAKAWYASRMRANALFVVAVGDFDPQTLRKELEASLSRLPAGGAVLPQAPAPIAKTGPGSLAKIEFPQSRGMGYLRGDFAAPAPSDPDYMALSIGMKVFSDLLFNVVRDKYGAVYTPSAYIRGFNANYGSIALFKTKIPGKAKAYIDEAAALLAAGKAVAIDPASSKDGFSPLADVLGAVKAQFVNELYESQATNAAIAGSIAGSVISAGDYRDYLLYVDRINAVTVDQVEAAVNKYLLKGSITWVALGSADVLISAQSGDFEQFSKK
jgi:zinc protease